MALLTNSLARHRWGVHVGGVSRLALVDAIQLIAGLTPLGLALGAAMADTGVSAPASLSTSVLLFGASAQLVAVSLLGAGAGVLSTLATITAVNTRLFVYSAVLRNTLGLQPRWFRWAGPYLLVDPLFAIVKVREPELPDAESVRTYYLVAGLALWFAWQPIVALGLFAGPLLPDGLSMEFAGPALFLTMLVPAIRTVAAFTAAIAGAVTMILLPELPAGFALLAAGLAGAAAASLGARWRTLR